MANSTIAEKIVQAETERQRITANIAAAYDEAEAKGATMPAAENSANLAETVASIPTDTTPTLITKQITENGTYTAAQDGADGYSEVTVNIPDQSKDTLNSLIDRSITTITSDVTSIGSNAFNGCTNLISVSLPEAQSVGHNAFNSCTNLISVSLPEALELGQQCFYHCFLLKTVDMPKVETLGYQMTFCGCSSLKRIFLPNVTNIGFKIFDSCDQLTAVILRKRATLANTNSFPLATQIIYVENSDLEWYSTATNWSAIYAEGRIKSIDELPPEEVTS